MRSARICSATLLIIASACARSPSPASSTLVPAGGHEVLTQQDLLGSGFKTALEVIQALRSNWLEVRGANSFQTPSTIKVYLDGVRLGGVDQLSSITIENVIYIRHYDGVTATARWGLDHGAGVIYISTHTGSQPI